MTLRVGADICGTFTGIVLSDSDGETYSKKVLTTYGGFSEGLRDDIERALRTADLAISTVDTVAHSTTLVADALIAGTQDFRQGVALREARVAHGYHGIGKNGQRRS